MFLHNPAISARFLPHRDKPISPNSLPLVGPRPDLIDYGGAGGKQLVGLLLRPSTS